LEGDITIIIWQERSTAKRVNDELSVLVKGIFILVIIVKSFV